MTKVDWIALASARFKGGVPKSADKTDRTDITPVATIEVPSVLSVSSVDLTPPSLFEAEFGEGGAVNQWRVFRRDGGFKDVTFRPARDEASVREHYPDCAALILVASSIPACEVCVHASRYGNCGEPIEAGLSDRFVLVKHPDGGRGCKHYAQH